MERKMGKLYGKYLDKLAKCDSYEIRGITIVNTMVSTNEDRLRFKEQDNVLKLFMSDVYDKLEIKQWKRLETLYGQLRQTIQYYRDLVALMQLDVNAAISYLNEVNTLKSSRWVEAMATSLGDHQEEVIRKEELIETLEYSDEATFRALQAAYGMKNKHFVNGLLKNRQ